MHKHVLIVAAAVSSVLVTGLMVSVKAQSSEGALPMQPAVVPKYQEVVGQRVVLDDFVEDAANWQATDRYAAWLIHQNRLKNDPNAKYEPYDFYGQRYEFSVRKGFGHQSDKSLRVRYQVGEPYRDEPYGIPKDDCWQKCYAIKKIPVDMTRFNRLSAWVYVEGLETATVFLGLETDYDDMKQWYA